MNNSRYITDVTIPDDSTIAANTQFVKTWRVENNGDTPWGEGYHLVFLRGTAMTPITKQPVPLTVPDQQADISIALTTPSQSGTYFGDWKLQDPQGNLFGQGVFLRIIVPQAELPPRDAPVPNTGVVGVRLVSHVTVPPGTNLAPGVTFVKTWRVENNGTKTWGAGFRLSERSGTFMAAQREHPVSPLKPGQQAELSVILTAPTQPGTYSTRWRLRTDKNSGFGDRLMVEINVVEEVAENRPFDPAAWQDVVWSITSIFESGRPGGNPAAYQTYDAGIISYGKHQATLASGSLGRVLQAYFRRSSSPTSLVIQQEYAARIAQKDAALREDARLKELLLQAATEQAMSEAQDEIFDQNFYQPAINQARQYNVVTPLGLACLYDTQIQGGLSILLPRVTEALGGKIGGAGTAGLIDETTWLRTFLQLREERLLRLADQSEARGDQTNARALRNSTFRVTELRKLLDANNLYLTGELLVRGQRTRGIS